jgi:hypothetical protein
LNIFLTTETQLTFPISISGSGDAHFHAHTQYATTMGEYINTVILGEQTRDGVIPYAGNIVCDKVCEELMMGTGNAIKFPFYEKMRPTAKFWVSKAGTLTPLHRGMLMVVIDSLFHFTFLTSLLFT